MKYFSAFTGAGGFEMGLPQDWECVGMSEVDKHANMVLRYRFPGVRNYGDIEKIDYAGLPDFELMLGGSPCQDVSIAGKRAGLAGVRSGLFFSYIALLKVKRPRYFVFENVKGLLSSNEGRDFAEVLNQFSEAGYNLWWQVLDAADFGVPQHRERIFIVGSAGGECPGKVFFERGGRKEAHGLQGFETNTLRREYRRNSANGTFIVEGRLDAQIERLNGGYQSDAVYSAEGLSPTLHRISHGGITKKKVAVPILTPGREKRQHGRRMKEDGEPSFTLTGQDRHGISDGMRVRYLTPLECERLMGWPDGWTQYGISAKGSTVELSDNARYNLTGNGVVPQIIKALIEHLIADA